MAELLLGPILRRADRDHATVWVETDRPCRVEIAGSTTRTFQVCGHYYALVVINQHSATEPTPYEVHLDGRRVWPEEGAPPSVIGVPGTDEPLRIAFGSCLASGPQEEPWTVHRRKEEQGLGPDSLRALALRVQQDPATRPDVLLLLGDQVYADSAAPELREWIRKRRDMTESLGEGVADYEEYAELYRRTWSDPAIRWLLSTVPTAMIFDDHEIIDDWNISEAWAKDIKRQPWWDERITTGLAAYWVYQHLGNLPVEELREDSVFKSLTSADGDGGEILFAAARDWDAGTTGTTGARWSYRRDVGRTTVFVLDSRNGRVLQPDKRAMLDEAEFAWLEEQALGVSDHLIIASSVPWLLPLGIHELEGWNEAVAGGAWGRRAAGVAERLRQAVDLEHWAAFRSSWHRLAALIERTARDPDPRAPASVLVLSGDVHYSYGSRMRFKGSPHRPVWQLVSSPLRYPTPSSLERAVTVASTVVSSLIGGLLARLAFLGRPSASWSTTAGPYQHNGVAELLIDGRHARVEFYAARGHAHPTLELAGELDLV